MLQQNFEDFLKKQLKQVPDCQGKTDLYDELLDELLTMSLEHEGKPEAEIYSICTKDLRDFSADIKIIKKDPKVQLKDNRLRRDVLGAFSAGLLATIIYLIVGFAFNAWAVGAMVIFPATLGLMYIYIMSKVLAKNFAKNKHKTTGVILSTFVLIATLIVYFVITFALDMDPAKTWCVFAIMPALFGVVHIVTQIAIRKKMVHPIALMIEILLVSLAVYLTVACVLWAFHPYWIIMVVAVLLDGIFAMYLINKKMK